MKISNSTSNYINQAYSQSKPLQSGTQAPKAEKAAADIPADSINLSSKTRDIQKISKAAEVSPVNRQELVARIKEQVESNQYTVDADQVAEKMAGVLMNEVI